MNVYDIQTLFEYNRWANSRTLQSVENLTEEQLNADMKNSFGGILSTLVHICGAEYVWLQRFTGMQPAIFIKKDDFPNLELLKTKWKEVEEGYAKYLAKLTEEELARTFTITTQKGDVISQKVWQALQHLVNHSTYHRGQITTMVRQIGSTPMGTDLITFYRQKNS